MIRALHRWPGLTALALLSVLAFSGAVLSVFPAAERLAAPQAGASLSVAELATRIQAEHAGVEQIRRAPSGRITAYWFDAGVPGAAVIGPATGRGVASADHNPTERWLTNLHRSLFLGDGGRIAAAVGAAAMLVLAVSGAALVARRTGGWRRWFAPPARPAGRAAPWRSGAPRRAGARAVLGHGALDDGVDLRSAARRWGPAGPAGGSERRDGIPPRRNRPLAPQPGRGTARAELPLSGRRHRRLHPQDRPVARDTSTRAPAHSLGGAI